MTNLIPISDARADLAGIVTRVSDNLDRVAISVNGQAKVVVISAEELDSLEETAEILSIPGMKKSILEGLKQAKKGLGIPLAKLK